MRILTSPLDSWPDFLKEGNNVAIRGRFHAVTLTLDIWPWTFIVHRVPHDRTLYQIWPKSNNSRRNYWLFIKFSPSFDPLTLKVCFIWGVMCSDSVPNLSEIQQFVDELVNFCTFFHSLSCKILGEGGRNIWVEVLHQPNLLYTFGAEPLRGLGDSTHFWGEGAT